MTEEILTETQDLSGYKSIFKQDSLYKKGLCPVTQIQDSGSKGSIPTPQHSLYYEIHGTGPVKLVFVMGMNSTSFSWLHQVEYFTTPTETLGPSKYSLIVFDNRGVGNSDTPKGPYTTSAMATDVITLLDYVGWTKRRDLHIISVSLGGMIAQELATLIPERIATLVLGVTTAGGRPWSNFPPWQGVATLTRITFIKDPNEKVPHVVRMVFPQKWLDSLCTDEGKTHMTNFEVQVELLARRIAVTRPQTPLGGLSQMAAGLTHHVTPDRLAKISRSIPKILILTGGEDNLVRSSNSFYLKEHMPEAELIQWKDTGHAIHQQYPAVFNHAVEAAVEKGLAMANAELTGTNAE